MCARDQRSSNNNEIHPEDETLTFLSFISFDWSHVLIWSRYRCNFLISFFKSASNFSFWFAFSVSWTYQNVPETIKYTKTIKEKKETDDNSTHLVPDAIEDIDAFLHLLQHPIDLALQLPTRPHGDTLTEISESPGSRIPRSSED